MRLTRMFSLSPVAIGVLAGIALLFTFPSIAAAQETCDSDGGGLPPDYAQLIATFPSDGAASVPTDGFIRLRYRLRAPLRAFVIVQDVSHRAPVMGTVNVVDAEVHWQSQAPLTPNTQYRVQVSDASGGAGDNIFTFTTGLSHSNDVAPNFGGAQDITFEKSGAADPCGDPNAAEITISWRRASSNGWPDSEMEYVIYETRGPGISGPVERARERLQPGASNMCGSNFEFCPAVRLSSANASGPVCFNVQAVDPYGRADGNTHEVCVDPSRGNFFTGCSVAQGRPASRPSALSFGWTAFAVGAAVWANRRRRASVR